MKDTKLELHGGMSGAEMVAELARCGITLKLTPHNRVQFTAAPEHLLAARWAVQHFGGRLLDHLKAQAAPPTSEHGACCACNAPLLHSNHLVAFAVKGSVPGCGWGCDRCCLPPDGAIAVICDNCLAEQVTCAYAVAGPLPTAARILTRELCEPHVHKPHHQP